MPASARLVTAFLSAPFILYACYDYSFPAVGRQRITRGNHAFPVANGAHGSVDCDGCHGELETFAQFTCISCHEHDESLVAPHHVGIDGFSYGPTTCYGCHPTGAVDGLDRPAHDVYFPIETGSHAEAACAACHIYDTRDLFSCIGCHEHEQAATTSDHQLVTDFVYTETSCYDCHPRSEVIDRASHGVFFPILTSNHALVTCQECHAAGYGSLTCIECHEHLCVEMNGKHREVGGYSCQSDECFACHPRGIADD